ncbi:hypothetical protein HDR61_03080 [bacterium]|nr:hypothetical protein [bacterium]
MKIEVSDLMDVWASLTFAYDVSGLDKDGVQTHVIDDTKTKLGLVQLEARNPEDLQKLREALAKYEIKPVEAEKLTADQFGIHPQTSAFEQYGITEKASYLAFDENRLTIDFNSLPPEAQELLEFFVVARAQSNMEYLNEVNKAKSMAAGIKRIEKMAQQAQSGIGSKGVNNLKQMIEQVAKNTYNNG